MARSDPDGRISREQSFFSRHEFDWRNIGRNRSGICQRCVNALTVEIESAIS